MLTSKQRAKLRGFANTIQPAHFTFRFACYTYVSSVQDKPMVCFRYDFFGNVLHQLFFYS